MEQKAILLTCPGCGARLSTDMKKCEWCHNPVNISSFDNMCNMSDNDVKKYARYYQRKLERNDEDIETTIALILCYIKLKLYDKAIEKLDNQIDLYFDNADLYFYSAVCMLKGKKAYLCKRNDIDKIIEYLDNACSLNTLGIYYYFMAYIKYDFYERNSFNTTPDYKKCIELAEQYGVTDDEKKQLFEMLSVSRPSELY